jgi:hypothetical protein
VEIFRALPLIDILGNQVLEINIGIHYARSALLRSMATNWFDETAFSELLVLTDVDANGRLHVM